MIVQSLWVLLLGMFGVFVVMGIITLALSIMYNLSIREKKQKKDETD